MRFFKTLFASKRVYLDHAAKTPMYPEVARALRRAEGALLGNPSAVHAEGRRARALIEDARRSIARTLTVKAEDVYFTSGGTESNNLALSGFFLALMAKGKQLSDIEVVTTAIEHPSILAVLSQWERSGLVVRKIPVDDEGLIDMDACEQSLNEKTALVTFAYANSEIGVVQEVKRLAHAVRKFRTKQQSVFPYIHLDASQAPLWLPCAADSLGVDMMTLDAAKFGGPAGVGILMRKSVVPLSPILQGGSQEEGLRPGTENAAGICAAALAFDIAQRDHECRALQVAKLRDRCFDALLKIPGVVVNGSRASRIAHNVNISIPGVDGEYAAVVLDTKGFAVSTKSACSGKTGSGSSVIYAMGGDDARALSTLRVTLGEATSTRDIDRLVRALTQHVEQTRAFIDYTRKK